MAVGRRFHSVTQRLTGAPVATGDTVVWRAPWPCRVTHIRAYRTGGAANAVNAKINSTNVLSANLTAGSSAFASGATDQTDDAGVGSGKMAAGDVLAFTVVSGDGTLLVLQADIEIDKDVTEL
ncbi:hypothetical protein HOU95_gp008 [Streptomyces phage Hiyaa]|jgi:hypothetical protein|uniref:Uncharacterized protein n=1 Tax=Streptomyces phage Hiyaa TaxID=2499072 RepID=A0A3S9U8P7_9CAUD|nr:hypothetical protein HOU95_gp008 [Streptomyces phage Hiyaa]AZS06648.1 hypothetical protein SEA_HIYAA_8 [Streptomyces phage Hiyaa]